MPPITAPPGESRPPRIIAGNAARAIEADRRVTAAAAPAASVTPASAATPPAMAHDAAKTRRALMPWASAASWSSAVARMARPSSSSGRTGRRRRAPTAARPMVHRSRTAMIDAADLDGVDAPGVAEVERLEAPDRGDHLLDDEQQPDRDHDHGEQRLADHAPQDRAARPAAPTSAVAASASRTADENGRPDVVGEVVGEVGAERDEAALGEVDDPGRLVDDHEARARRARSGARGRRRRRRAGGSRSCGARQSALDHASANSLGDGRAA